MQGPTKTIDVVPQRVETCPVRTPGTRTALALVLCLALGNLALFPSLKQAAALPMTVPVEEMEAWSLNAPRVTYKPGNPKKVLLVNDSYRQMRSSVEEFTHSVSSIRQGIRQQIALSDVLLALQKNKPDITAEEAQQMLLDAGYDIPTPEVVEAMRDGQSQFRKDDNTARARFAQDIATEIIKDKISGLLKNIELITRVGEYVLVDAPKK